MNAFTNFEQSKKLAEILPLESADMGWSLTALLGVLKERNDCNTLEMFTNKAQLYTITTSYYKDASWKNMSTVSDNPVDACYEMIVKLKESSLI